MLVSGFTYVRNGIMHDYPFMECIKALLSICDEVIVVVGDSTDGTREAIAAIRDPGLRIVDSVWPEDSAGGRRYAMQANLGLDRCRSRWCFHLQADELFHEQDLLPIARAMEKHKDDPKVEGFLFRFINFFGDYWHWAPSRRFHQREIRIVRNNPNIRSYKDSQGFRMFKNPQDQWNEKGRKLRVVPLDIPIYHYSHARNPVLQRKRQIEFTKGYLPNEEVEKQFAQIKDLPYDYNNIDYLKIFHGSHPSLMKKRVDAQDWDFIYDPKKNNMTLKERFMKLLEDWTGEQLFTYRNYRTINR